MHTEDSLTQLLDVLSRETELYQAMSTVMNKEKAAVIQSELIALNEAQIEKENILVALGLLEGQRRHLVASLTDTLGCTTREINLTKISKLVGEPLQTGWSRRDHIYQLDIV
jgi:flagellar biosynthesis/type III secretory pathway chaperone